MDRDGSEAARVANFMRPDIADVYSLSPYLVYGPEYSGSTCRQRGEVLMVERLAEARANLEFALLEETLRPAPQPKRLYHYRHPPTNRFAKQGLHYTPPEPSAARQIWRWMVSNG